MIWSMLVQKIIIYGGRLQKVSRIATIPDLLVKYRIHSSQITKKKRRKKYYKMMIKLMEERFSDIGFKSSDIENFS